MLRRKPPQPKTAIRSQRGHASHQIADGNPVRVRAETNRRRFLVFAQIGFGTPASSRIVVKIPQPERTIAFNCNNLFAVASHCHPICFPIQRYVCHHPVSVTGLMIPLLLCHDAKCSVFKETYDRDTAAERRSFQYIAPFSSFQKRCVTKDCVVGKL